MAPYCAACGAAHEVKRIEAGQKPVPNMVMVAMAPPTGATWWVCRACVSLANCKFAQLAKASRTAE